MAEPIKIVKLRFYLSILWRQVRTLAEHIYTYINPTSKKHLEQACCALEKGGVIAYPTDVNWAIGCDPSKPKALKRMFALKPSHPKEQPFSLICNSLSMLAQVAFLDQSAYRMLKKALPGPYTLLLLPQKKLARQFKDKRKVVGVRVPDSPLLLDLIELYGKPLVTSSLVFPERTFFYGTEVHDAFGHCLDLILDLGEEVVAYETSIVDLTEGTPEIIRQGKGNTDFFR